MQCMHMTAHLHEAALGKRLVDGEKPGDAAGILLRKTPHLALAYFQKHYFEFQSLKQVCSAVQCNSSKLNAQLPSSKWPCIAPVQPSERSSHHTNFTQKNQNQNQNKNRKETKRNKAQCNGKTTSPSVRQKFLFLVAMPHLAITVQPCIQSSNGAHRQVRSALVAVAKQFPVLWS
jgi:hypothetical protein